MTVEEKTVQILEKFENLATQYTPDAIDLGLQATSMNGIANILIGFALLAIALIVFFAGMKLRSHFIKLENAVSDTDALMSTLFGCIFSSIFFIIALVYIFNFWQWIAIFNPKLFWAHRILGL